MIKLPTVVTKFGVKAGVWLTKHGPTIMSVGGGAMAIGGAVLACRATLHAEEVIAHHQEKMRQIAIAKEISDAKVENGEVEYGNEVYSEKQMKMDKAIAYRDTAIEFAKLYAPAVGLGLGGVGLMQGAFTIMKGRHGKAIAALGALDKAYTSLLAQRDAMGLPAVPETIPAEPIDISENADGEKMQRIIPDVDEIDDPFLLIFDARNENWDNAKCGFVQNSAFVRSRLDGMIYKMDSKQVDWFWINDAKKELGLADEQDEIGHDYGWNGLAGDRIAYEITPYVYGDDLMLHKISDDDLKELELQDNPVGYCLAIRLLSDSYGHDGLISPRMIYHEVYGK